MSIEKAELDPQHAQIVWRGDYLLSDLNSSTGTWIKVQETLMPGEKLEPLDELRVGSVHFRVEQGEPEALEDHWIQRYSLESLRSFFSNKTLDQVLSLNPQEVECASHDKENLCKALEEMKQVPRTINKLRLVSQNKEFQVGWKPVTIGSSGLCDVVIPGISSFQAKVSFTKEGFFVMNLDEESFNVYKRLLPNEKLKLVPGRSFRIGKIEFEACKFNTGKSSQVGLRPTMEDAEKVIQNLFLEEEPVFYCGVFDGHGGNQCSEFLKENLHFYIKNNLRNQPYENWPSLLTAAFKQCDEDYYKSEPERGKENGSTAVVLLVKGRKLLVCNVGDSRAVLSRGGEALQLTTDHRPDNQEESQRIEGQGGMLIFGRVLGKLAVTRAFGDFEFKDISNAELGVEVKGPLVTAEPQITQVEISETDDFLVVACDGLFEAYTNEEVVRKVKEKLRKMQDTEQDLARAIHEIVSEAVGGRQTSDNVTAFLISLCPEIK
eukprot:CAMPEP_0202438066 /NCGR_PEP_ID=MMETSP1345-20130828/32269_1 /ASSEMBLY_ACC=CAM_ASM_000843 /TAXON_ID=342563 /ORGANISM="Fabrea Fabrea salina" /LENGTH=490 /DNA_ID=CAMNT_0049052123 /DNA_START=77 /DNA_END=1546 /DNA_ORIENTATION=-